MKRCGAAREGGQIAPFPDVRHRIMKSPNGFAIGGKLLVRRISPFLEHGRYLRHRQHAGIDGPNYKIMCHRIRDHRFLVATDSLILLTAHVGQATHGRMHDPWQVPFDKSRMPASDGDLAAKRVG